MKKSHESDFLGGVSPGVLWNPQNCTYYAAAKLERRRLKSRSYAIRNGKRSKKGGLLRTHSMKKTAEITHTAFICDIPNQ